MSCQACVFARVSEDADRRLLCMNVPVMLYWMKKLNNPDFIPGAYYEEGFGETCGAFKKQWVPVPSLVEAADYAGRNVRSQYGLEQLRKRGEHVDTVADGQETFDVVSRGNH